MTLKLDDIKEGDVLIADDGFTCLSERQHCTVKSEAGLLYVECNEGHHMLDGQRNEGGECVGFAHER